MLRFYRGTLTVLSCSVLATCFLVGGFSPRTARAGTDDVAQLLPENTPIYIEITQPERLVDRLLATDLATTVRDLPQVKEKLKSPEVGKFLLGLELVEHKLGHEWPQALRLIGGGGIYLAFDPETKGVLVAVRAKDAQILPALNSALMELGEAQAKNEGRPSTIKSKEYNGITGYSFGGEEAHVILDDLLVVSNKADALKGMIDRKKSGGKSLADDAQFKQARSARPASAIGWAVSRLDAYRADPKYNEILNNATRGNPLAELLFGQVIEGLRTAPFTSATLELDGNSLRLTARLPRGAKPEKEARPWFAPASCPGARRLVLGGPELLTLNVRRDVGGLWDARDTLFDEKVKAGLTQAETGLANFFGGRDLGTEVLDEICPDVQVVLARQKFAEGQPVPANRLPAGAVVLQLKHPESFGPALEISFQQIVGLTNVNASQQGRAQFLLETGEYHGAKLTAARYLPKKDQAASGVGIEYNFSPTSARVGDYFVMASSTDLAHQVIDAIASPAAASAGPPAHTKLNLNLGEIAAAVEANREALITQNMLSKGPDRPATEAEFGPGLKLLKTVRTASWQLEPADDAFVMTLAVELAEAK